MARTSVALLIAGPLVVAAVWLVLGVALQPGTPNLGDTVMVTGAAATSSSRAPGLDPPTATGTARDAHRGSAGAGAPPWSTAASGPASSSAAGAAGAPSTRPARATGAPVTSLPQGATSPPTGAAASTRAVGTASSQPGSSPGGAAAVTMAAGVCPAGDNGQHDDDDDGDLDGDDDPDDGCDD